MQEVIFTSCLLLMFFLMWKDPRLRRSTPAKRKLALVFFLLFLPAYWLIMSKADQSMRDKIVLVSLVVLVAISIFYLLRYLLGNRDTR